jgi:hypothetical protein
MAYRLQLPPRARIHDVFHVTFLKRFDGVVLTAIAPLPPIVRDRVVPMPQEVVRAKPTTNSWELLVKWQGCIAAEASWEQLDAFKEAYPDFQLKDKLFRQEGGSVMDSYFQKRYSKRKKGVVAQVGPNSGLSVGLIIVSALRRFIVILGLMLAQVIK